MESSGLFGIPGTMGESQNRSLFKRMERTLDSLKPTLEILALELHIADLRSQFKNGSVVIEEGHIKYEELDKARRAAKRLMEIKIRKIMEAE